MGQHEREADCNQHLPLRYLGAHCTGIELVQEIMTIAALKRNKCIVGSVGAIFDPAIGFIAGQLTMGPDKNACFKK